MTVALADVIHLPEQPRTVQVEDGYTRVAHGILEALALADLSKRHYKVLLVMVRQTYGYNKKSDEVSLSQFEAKTGVMKPNVSTAIDELLAMGVLVRTPGTHAHCLSINKAYGQWTGKAKVDISKVWGYQNNNPRVIETIKEGYQNDNSEVIESITTKDNSKRQDQKTTPKENLSSSLRELFEIFWAKYPRKKSRATAEKAFAKLNPNEQLLEDLVAGLERAKTSEQWSNPRFIPHAGTWLNAKGWMDEVQTEYSAAERAVIQAFNEALGEQIGSVDESVFVEARAGAIRAFVSHRPQDPDFWKRYFPAIRADVSVVPPRAGFDYVISGKGFSDVSGRMKIARGATTTVSGVRTNWHETGPGTEARGAELGVIKHEGENAVSYRRRVFKAAGPGEWQRADLAAEAKYGTEAYARLESFYNDDLKEKKA